MMRNKTVLGASLFVLALGLAGAANGQDPTPILGGPPGGYRVAAEQPARRSISIPAGKSATIDFDRDLRMGGTTNPKVADVRVVTPRHVSVLGVGYGQTDAQFYDANGRLVLVLDVRVEQDTKSVQETLARILPEAQIEAQAVNDGIVLSGVVKNAAQADKAVQIASMYAGRPEMVKNLLTITGKDQVTLKVQVVEVNRSVVKQLGFDTNAALGRAGSPQYFIGNTPSYAVNGGFQGGAGIGYQLDNANNDIRAALQAFERQGLVRTLAEPNLTAVSGEAAKFLAGGEYPVPAGRDQQGNISIEFKPYGVGLGFTPVVLSDGRISLQISTEVSELTTQGALTLAGVGGAGSTVVIPALTVRRVQNTIELPSGGSMMIAGLLQEQTRQNIDKIPGISDVPILGALARSRDFLNAQTELVIIVTAYLTDPANAGSLQSPADGLRIASDPETILLGKLNSAYGAPPEALEGRTYQGPFGHVID